MIRYIIVLILCFSNVFASETYSKSQVENMIAKMLILGFDGKEINSSSKIYKDIKKYNLGGVILFEKDSLSSKKYKNILNPKQLQKLTSKLQSIRNEKLLISIDQEGGYVQRLRKSNGFISTSSAKRTVKRGENYARKSYAKLGLMLKENGINLNFAPVVDLSINPKNEVIVKIKRSYGKDPKVVSKYASIFIDELEKQNVISVLKHFPGHGSSRGDSHYGFVDITNTWKKKELEPYEFLIKKNKVHMIMTAHVLNQKLDKNNPATLSYKINTELLREKLNYKGVIISDDLQMRAISEHYTLIQTLRKAINSGVDILLFGNQIGKKVDAQSLIKIIYNQIQKGNISLDRIIESNNRIENLTKKI